MVCGAPLGNGALFNKGPRYSEVCSDECASIYFDDCSVSVDEPSELAALIADVDGYDKRLKEKHE